MSTKTKTCVALLTSVFLCPGLFAQKIDVPPPDGVIAGEERGMADAEELGWNPGVRGRVDAQSLRFKIEGYKFRLMQGRPGDLCAIFVGLPSTPVRLPGGAMLRIEPVVLVASGRIDAYGQYRTLVGYDSGMFYGQRFYFQAIAVGEDDVRFQASNVEVLDFAPPPVEPRRTLPDLHEHLQDGEKAPNDYGDAADDAVLRGRVDKRRRLPDLGEHREDKGPDDYSDAEDDDVFNGRVGKRRRLPDLKEHLQDGEKGPDYDGGKV